MQTFVFKTLNKNLVFDMYICRLPDDDRDICVFDYYVDESGEWDPWTSK